VPAGAQVRLGGRAYPVALDGLVYVEGVTGRVSAEARWGSERCEFETIRPATDEPVPDLGQVPCRVTAP